MTIITTRNPNKSIIFSPIVILVSVTVISLLPFAAKPFNIDEPLFVWVAKQIQAHPLDFYGFRINWYGTALDAARVIKNPPLASYYLSLAAALSGWKELPIHLAFLLPAVAATVGTYLLAREFTQNPLAATLIGTLSPVYILSGATVMCDTMMLAFYVWAAFLWVRGLRNDSWRDMGISALLIALCSLTKYFGISLIPLLLIFTLTAGKDQKNRALFLLIPVAILCLYQWGTLALYGRGLLSDAASYASKEKGLNIAGIFPSLVTGLSFTGGCLISTLFFAPILWNKRTIGIASLAILLAPLPLSRLGYPHLAEQASWSYFLQLSLFVAAGINLLVLAWLELRRHKSPESLLLALWFAGTFVFAAIVNWTVNGRSILPMAPVAGILVMRHLERMRGENWRPPLASLLLPLTCAWLVSMAVAWADFRLAATAREAATAVARNFGGVNRPVWFQGHWGFQYYMEKNGGVAYDRKVSAIQPGDVMVVPENNTNAFPEIMEKGTPTQILRFTPASFLTTMNFNAGAGYYSSGFGPLPFLVDKGLEEIYHVVVFPQSYRP
jgi:4-amino-4-deoxy-L-arabinose transferase-like glycosyltransferase